MKKITIALLAFVSITSFGAAVEISGEQIFLREFVACFNAIRADRQISLDDVLGLEEAGGKGVLNVGVYKVSLRNSDAIFCKGSFAGAFEARNCQVCMEFLDKNYVDEMNTDYPRFARYLGYFSYKGFVTEREKEDLMCRLYGVMSRGMLLSAEAKGAPFLDFFLEHSPREDVIRRVGAQIARFHMHFLERRGDELFSHLHGDLHVDNIFVSLEPFVVTFIDYDQMATSIQGGKGMIVAELELFLKRSQELLFRRAQNQEDIMRLLNLFIEGYYEALAEHAMLVDMRAEEL